MVDGDVRWFGSDLLVDRLAALGVQHVALNPGASIRGFHDSLTGPVGRAPEMLLAMHEGIAVAIAHGYAKVTGKPMAVGLHDTVGLLHGSMAIFNAFIDRAPMVVLVGTGPLDSSRRRPWLDWIHTVGEQGEIVRELTVWNEQPTSIPALLSAADRAVHAASAAPSGPALIGLDVDLQEAPAGDGPAGVIVPLPRPRLGPDPLVVREIVADLRTATRPLIVTDRPLDAAASRSVCDLATAAGAGLLELGGGATFPVGHAHDVTEAASDALAMADYLLFVEVRDPAWALGPIDLATRRVVGGGQATKAARIGLSQLMARSWIVTEAQGPARLELISDPALALEAILSEWGPSTRDLHPDLVRLAATPVPTGPTAEADDRGLYRSHVARVVAEAISGQPWTLANGVFGGWARRNLRFQEPDQFLGRSGGEGLGYGAGAAIGAALAYKGSGRLVLDLQADGDLLYTPQAMWTAAHHEIPLLMIVDGNRTYSKDELHQRVIAKERGRPVTHASRGIVFDAPAIDHAAMARSMGVWASGPIADLAALRVALTEAIGVVRGGQPAVLEVRTSPVDG